MERLVAVDAGTTGVRALAVDRHGRVLDVVHRPLTQSYPSPGLVEHDASEILMLVDATLVELTARLRDQGDSVAAIGITNQRETTVALDRRSGAVLAPAIVWQDRRTAARCQDLRDAGHAEPVRERTGLTIDPYFSATKMQWLAEHGKLDGASDLGLCTVDTLVLWHLTGAHQHGGVFATDPSNASRTMLYDINAGAWSDELCALFGVPRGALATVLPSCGPFGTVRRGDPALDGVPISGILGDQQAALFGQRCTRPGMVKATFGTGAFLLANAGSQRPVDTEGLLTSIAWDLGDHGGVAYALEGSSFVAGAAIQWLRDELGLLDDAAQTGPLASSVDSSNGVAFVPALTGLGSPWWDPDARGALVGLSRGATRAHVARAVVEALAFQGRAMLDAMRDGGGSLEEVRVDGGAVAMDLLCKLLADVTRLTVRRPGSVEATAIGAATIAGVGVGACTMPDLDQHWQLDAAFSPAGPEAADLAYDAWLEAVARARALGS